MKAHSVEIRESSCALLAQDTHIAFAEFETIASYVAGHIVGDNTVSVIVEFDNGIYMYSTLVLSRHRDWGIQDFVGTLIEELDEAAGWTAAATLKYLQCINWTIH